jgi:hypothetical protein
VLDTWGDELVKIDPSDMLEMVSELATEKCNTFIVLEGSMKAVSSLFCL